MSAAKRVLLIDLFALEQLPPIEIIKSLQRDGVIANSMMSCEKCNKDIALLPRKDVSDKFGWRCSKCGLRKPIRVGSWFSLSRLTLPKILQLTYMWVVEFRNKDVVRELELSEVTVVDWYNFCREICVEILLTHEEKIGVPGIIVEIDESKFGKQKYNRGKHVDGQWVFGGIERGSGKCFLEVVQDRTSNTLIALIEANIKDGTTIISDCWKAYKVLGKMEYEHLTVNHSINFKDPETDAHTNTIEGTWSVVKRFLSQTNRSKKMFSSSLAAFMYSRLRKNSLDLYRQFITDITRVYNPAQPDN